MKFITMTLFFFPLFSQAHCPFEINVDQQTYCLNIQWKMGDRKIQGQLTTSDQASPHLITMGTVPQKWIYSRAEFAIWKKGDSTHKPVHFKEFRIFPYMMMQNGHHHSAAYDFSYDAISNLYILSNTAFQKMKGCWSLRWTIEDSDNLKASQKLMDITDYQNLNDAEVLVQESFCMDASPSDPDEHQGHTMHMH